MLAIEDVSNEIEAMRYMECGSILVLVPHLIPQMTRPDRVEILEWSVKEGDIVQPDSPMLTVDFLGDDWYLPVPPLSNVGCLRVARIAAAIGDIVHLDDPLIVLEPLRDTNQIKSPPKSCIKRP